MAFSSWGADHGFIGSFLDRWHAFPQLSANEPQSPTGIARDVAYVFLPGEAFCDGNSKVFTCVHHLKCVAMETVCSVDDYPASRGDPDDSALSRVEAHLPSLFPLFQSCEVFLEELSVIVVLDHLEDCAVIRKQFGGRRLDHIWEVINEDLKQ